MNLYNKYLIKLAVLTEQQFHRLQSFLLYLEDYNVKDYLHLLNDKQKKIVNKNPDMTLSDLWIMIHKYDPNNPNKFYEAGNKEYFDSYKNVKERLSKAVREHRCLNLEINKFQYNAFIAERKKNIQEQKEIRESFGDDFDAGVREVYRQEDERRKTRKPNEKSDSKVIIEKSPFDFVYYGEEIDLFEEIFQNKNNIILDDFIYMNVEKHNFFNENVFNQYLPKFQKLYNLSQNNAFNKKFIIDLFETLIGFLKAMFYQQEIIETQYQDYLQFADFALSMKKSDIFDEFYRDYLSKGEYKSEYENTIKNRQVSTEESLKNKDTELEQKDSNERGNTEMTMPIGKITRQAYNDLISVAKILDSF